MNRAKEITYRIRLSVCRSCIFLYLQFHAFLKTAGGEKGGVVTRTAGIVRSQGVLALYNGLSASLLRQLTYSTTRFAIYELSAQRNYLVWHDVYLFITSSALTFDANAQIFNRRQNSGYHQTARALHSQSAWRWPPSPGVAAASSARPATW